MARASDIKKLCLNIVNDDTPLSESKEIAMRYLEDHKRKAFTVSQAFIEARRKPRKSTACLVTYPKRYANRGRPKKEVNDKTTSQYTWSAEGYHRAMVARKKGKKHKPEEGSSRSEAPPK